MAPDFAEQWHVLRHAWSFNRKLSKTAARPEKFVPSRCADCNQRLTQLELGK